ncbi:hypothetical protein PR048_005136 [Dryococelus australis]|uniref:Uncharacterized protein n=1 Tax=Dryococelus australis TaxID=614101 RepID=A0ABQ9I8H9_9NEOP|nr:hypothetical protein PR048_005136 [Dryococelus australis]
MYDAPGRYGQGRFALRIPTWFIRIPLALTGDDGLAHVLKPYIGILPAFPTHSRVLHSSLATKSCKDDIRMNRFTFSETADMHLCYGAANG